MRRLLVALSALSWFPAVSVGAPPDAGTVSAVAPAPVPGSADITVDASRLEEARALVPPPLLHARFQPVVGAWVELEFQSKQGRFPVRVAVVAETRREDGLPLYQVELDYATTPRTLMALWVVGGGRPVVERLAISVPPNAPISLPVDLYMDQPELRGTQVEEKPTEVRGGPFAGKARRSVYRRDAKRTVTVVVTDRVPVLGVESIREDEGTWVARKSGTGATPELSAVPIAIPRLPGQ